MVIKCTPIEKHGGVWVKREDLSCPSPGPAFSKVRGLASHMVNSTAIGFACLDMATSKAGWGTAYLAKALGRGSIVYYPSLKEWEGQPGPYQRRAKQFGAELRPLSPGRSSVLWYQARADLRGSPYIELLPNGLRLPETVVETAEELLTVSRELLLGTIVVNVGSGTICSGVLTGLIEAGYNPSRMIGVTTHKVVAADKRKRILDKVCGAVMMVHDLPNWFSLVVTDCGYADREDCPCPFPCNPWYDRKAWRWLVDNQTQLPEPILFWNIGA